MNFGKRAAVASGLLGMLCVLAELCFLLPDLLVARDALPFYKANLGLFRGILQACIVATFVLGAAGVLQPPETYVGQLLYPFRRRRESTPYG